MARGADVVRAQGLDHRAAHQARDDGDLRQRKGQDGADLVDQRAVAPAADWSFQSQPKTSWMSGAMTKVGMVLPAVATAITSIVGGLGSAGVRR
jgi:hypothetical protein